jgi:endoglucanase
LRKELLLKKRIFLLFVFLITVSSVSFGYNYVDALEKAIWFFDANKCGPDVQVNNVFSSWRGACHTSDGGDAGLDLTGGYHDAGDHVKFGLPQAFSASMLGWALYEYRDVFDDAGLTSKLLDTIKYFTDYFLKGLTNSNTFYYQVGDGDVDHGYWGPPESQTGSRPVVSPATPSNSCSDITGMTASALALMYLNYQSTDSSYASQCREAAIDIYNIALNDNSRGTDGGGGNFYDSSAHYDDLSWGAIWMYEATGDSSYLDPVEAWQDIAGDYGGSNWEFEWSSNWDNITPPVMLKMAQITSQQNYYDAVVYSLDWFRNNVERTPYGLPYLDSWGALRYASFEAGYGYMAEKLLSYNGYRSLADFSIDYILGDNPRNGCYMTNYLNNPSQHPHHRANEPNRDGVTNDMIGALVGGPDNQDNYNDDVNDYTRNEVAIDYNASLILGLAGRAFFEGGGTTTPPTSVPTQDPNVTPTPSPGGADGDIKVQYKCAETNVSAQQIKPHINIVNEGSINVSLSELTVRYFYTKEGSTSEEFNVDYAIIGSGNISGSFHDGFLEVSFSSGAGTLEAGAQTGEMQLRFNKTDWSNYNQDDDWSFDPSITTFTNYYNIALYQNGTLIWGNEAGAVPDDTPVPTEPPADTPTPVITNPPQDTPVPTTPSEPGTGDVWFVPDTQSVGTGSNFTTEIHVNTGSQLLAAYGFDINFDSNIISVNTDIGTSGVEEGPDGYVAAVNAETSGFISMSGFDTDGTGPGTNLNIVIVNWTAGNNAGTSALDLVVNDLIDENTNVIGSPNAIDGSVTVTDVTIGDVNDDGNIDIVDALLTAQFYVGLDPAGFNSAAADVDCNGTVDIVDALQIAQYYVGLITEFC